ncbi:hypothetical protein TrVE_jg1918 [Triparma verrucosa]|uniref:Cytochrome b561 bacterial/Ni-hydrogenase domain-containing protein n=1 Tax=Triparma verrucosa TaxID=1606542 RepID=A0A9W7CEA8_9STRA|nr:hypothetical protein TrVE_jg1918 [Triparma verrucosa]
MISKNLKFGIISKYVTLKSLESYTSHKYGSCIMSLTGYTFLQSSLHWFSAPALLSSIGLVLTAQQTGKGEKTFGMGKGDLMYYHKSFGTLSFFLLLPRLSTKLLSPKVGALLTSSSFEQKAANISHRLLYGFITVMPVTGVAMGMWGGKGLPFFGRDFKAFQKKNGTIAKYSFKIHKTIGTYGKYLVPLHVGAAGVHGLQKGGIMWRINPFRNGRM